MSPLGTWIEMPQKHCGGLGMEMATNSHLNSVGLGNEPHALVSPVLPRKPDFCLIFPDIHHIIPFYE